jgi:hypothetical protein
MKAQSAVVFLLVAALGGIQERAMAADAPPHATTVTLGGRTVAGDHIVETGRGQRITVRWINPIKYDVPYVSDTQTSIQAPAPTFTLPGGLAVGQSRALTPPCDNPANCDAAVALQTTRRSSILADFDLRSKYAVNALSILTDTSNDFDLQALKSASGMTTSDPSVPATLAPCIMEIAQYARSLGSGFSRFASIPTSSCSGASTLPVSISDVLGRADDYQRTIDKLKIDLDSFRGNFTSPAPKDAATYKSILGDLDLAAYGTQGANGTALLAKEQALKPFFDIDLSATQVYGDVLCSPYSADGRSHSLTLTATNRFDNTKNLSQSVATVDCPGAFAVSAGFGISTLPFTTFQLAPTLANGAVTYTVEYQDNRPKQTVAVALAHYFLASLGGQTSLYATGGLGTSTSQVDAYYGLSIGIGHRVFINVAEHAGTFNQLPPGVALHAPAPSGFTIPVTKSSTTKLSYTISFSPK